MPNRLAVAVSVFVGACAHPHAPAQRTLAAAPRAAQPATAEPSPDVAHSVGATPRRLDFVRDVRPILERCQPCHFSGGQMYDRLPFDRPETVRLLGAKLFTRIKDDASQATIREFLADAR